MSHLIFFLILLLPLISFFFIGFSNIFLIILLQSIAFSLLIYPAFCGLFKKKLLAYFTNHHYFRCAVQGLYIFANLTIYGTILMAIFIVINNKTPSNLKILTTTIGGVTSTIWLFHLTNLAIFPLLLDKPLRESIKLSKQIAKNNRIELFKLILQTYIRLLTIILIPHATNAYIKKAKLLLETEQTQKKYVLH